MNLNDDDARSVGGLSSSSAKASGQNRSKFIAARNRVDALERQLAAKDNDLQAARERIAVLEFELTLQRNAVTTLLSRPQGERPASFDRPRLDPVPAAGSAPAPLARPSAAPARRPEVCSTPSRPASPPPSFIVPNLPEPPILPDPRPRLVITSQSVPALPDAAPAPRSIFDRLGRSIGRGGHQRARPHRGNLSSSPERRSGPRRGTSTPPGSSELPPLYFTEGAASRRPPHP